MGPTNCSREQQQGKVCSRVLPLSLTSLLSPERL